MQKSRVWKLVLTKKCRIKVDSDLQDGRGELIFY
jgi:hypothetical protein